MTKILKKGFTPTPQRDIMSLFRLVVERVQACFVVLTSTIVSEGRHKKVTARLVSGFTLVELLVVIAIIGILSSVVLASLNTAREKARDAKRISDVKQLQLALELYYDDNGGYPLALDVASLVTNGYLPAIPVPPEGTGETAYRYAGLGTGCTSYHIGVTLENTNNDVLTSDLDVVPDAAGATACGGAADFDSSTNNAIYDLKP